MPIIISNDIFCRVKNAHFHWYKFVFNKHIRSSFDKMALPEVLITATCLTQAINTVPNDLSSNQYKRDFSDFQNFPCDS